MTAIVSVTAKTRAGKSDKSSKPASKTARTAAAPVGASPDANALRVEQGWQELLERGLQRKTELLRSTEFKTTAQASELLGIGEPAVRKRIREGKLFALQTPGDGGHRIPAWALDPAIAGQATVALLSDVQGGTDEWQLYHALTTPNGALNGLRPFECLMSRQHLPPSARAAREELLAHLQLPANGSLLEAVRRAVAVDLDDVGGAA